ncbi:hypothetical protein GCM10023213_22910 [Prosthecobacter algae]|uniref:Uncharacterized protein n=1 Tax=Prosthecobacter algae TaxID=1144682 RepID=A0ABP9P3U5_9BACT
MGVCVVMAAAFMMSLVMCVIVPTAFMMHVAMVMPATFMMHMLVFVVMIMPAAAFGFFGVIMAAVLVVVVTTAACPMVVAFAAGDFGPHGQQIEQAHDGQADARVQNHRTEDAVAREVLVHTARVMEIQQHGAPEEQQSNADEMGESAGSAHGMRMG